MARRVDTLSWMASASISVPALPALAATWPMRISKGLVKYVTGMQRWPTEIGVVHGEPRAKNALTIQLHDCYSRHERPLALVAPGC